MNNQDKVEEILNKQFKKSIFSGYDPLDVDEFFDQVCEYLKLNDKRVKEAESTAKELKDKNDSLTEQVKQLQQELSQCQTLIEEYKRNGYDNIINKNKFQDQDKKEGK